MVFGRKEDLALATGTRTHAHCRRQIKCGGDETCMSITRRWDEHKCRSNVPRIKQYNNCVRTEHTYEVQKEECFLKIAQSINPCVNVSPSSISKIELKEAQGVGDEAALRLFAHIISRILFMLHVPVVQFHGKSAICKMKLR